MRISNELALALPIMADASIKKMADRVYTDAKKTQTPGRMDWPAKK
jgi:hypothetical protein